jgi:hypothetical protein
MRVAIQPTTAIPLAQRLPSSPSLPWWRWGRGTDPIPDPSAAARETARTIAEELHEYGFGGDRAPETLENIRARIALALDAFAEKIAAARVADYARTVDDPRRAHLHYDGCPYKPFADLPRWETPDDAPACTCAEAHKAAYWKGQCVLERSNTALRVAEERERRAELRNAAAIVESVLREYAEVRREDVPRALNLAGYLAAAIRATPGGST